MFRRSLGRLYEKCVELLAGADIQYTRSNRLDVCLVRNHNMALVFLPAADIPRFVGEGNVDLGITGQDMVAEASTSTFFPPSVPTTPSATENGDMMEASTSSLPQPQQLSDLITQVLPLGFGKCKLQIQAPERNTHIQKAEDLVGRRVATSFDGLAGAFFKELDAKANATRTDGKKIVTKIEYVGGSVEAACALGVADGIVDLVGESLISTTIAFLTYD